MPTNRQPYRPIPITDHDAWMRIAAKPTAAAQLAKQLANLDRIALTMPLPTAADYLAAKRSNDRGRLDDHWRKVRPNFARLVTNRLVKGIDPNDPDDRLLNWTFAFVGMPTWVVSAHLPNNDLPLTGEGQLDLAGCEACGEIAEAAEVLAPWIDAQSGTLRQTMVRELDRRVIGPVMASEFPAWWAKLDAKRTDAKRINNWTGVCAGSILAACMALEAMGEPRPACRDRMTQLLRVFFDVAFGEGGECEEGIGYWNYGVDFACLPMSRMSRDALSATFDVARVKQVAEYPASCHLVGNLFFAGNDSEPKSSTTPGIIGWLGDLVDSDFLRWWSVQSDPGSLRTVPHLLRYLQWASQDQIPTSQAVAAPGHAPNRFLADQQAAIFQRSSSRGLFTFTITGGTNGELHNHNDLGTFQLFLDDRLIIPDLGAPRYVTDYFNDATRYTKYLVAASGGHCCPMINGEEQQTGTDAAGKLMAWRPETGEVALDLTAAYPPAAKLKRWTRSAHVPNDDALAVITDEFQLDGDGEIVHRIWFADEPAIERGGAQISVPGATALTIEPQPTSTSLFAIKAGDDRLMLRGYAKDRTLYRLDLTYHVAANQPLTVTTTIHV